MLAAVTHKVEANLKVEAKQELARRCNPQGFSHAYIIDAFCQTCQAFKTIEGKRSTEFLQIDENAVSCYTLSKIYHCGLFSTKFPSRNIPEPPHCDLATASRI